MRSRGMRGCSRCCCCSTAPECRQGPKTAKNIAQEERCDLPNIVYCCIPLGRPSFGGWKVEHGTIGLFLPMMFDRQSALQAIHMSLRYFCDIGATFPSFLQLAVPALHINTSTATLSVSWTLASLSKVTSSKKLSFPKTIRLAAQGCCCSLGGNAKDI